MYRLKCHFALFFWRLKGARDTDSAFETHARKCPACGPAFAPLDKTLRSALQGEALKAADGVDPQAFWQELEKKRRERAHREPESLERFPMAWQPVITGTVSVLALAVIFMAWQASRLDPGIPDISSSQAPQYAMALDDEDDYDERAWSAFEVEAAELHGRQAEVTVVNASNGSVLVWLSEEQPHT